MENKQRVTVISAVPYEFKADNGVTYTGMTLNFLESDNLSPYLSRDGVRGFPPMKTSVPENMSGSLNRVPAIYDLTFSLRSDAKKGIIAKVTDIEYVADLPALVEA